MSLTQRPRGQGKPLISIIAAVGTNGQIGLNGGIPWKDSEDLKRFKYLTMGKPVVMGRMTYESIGGPLPGRQTVIITSQDPYNAPMCMTAKSVREAIQGLTQNHWNKEIFIIGGESIYKEVMAYADLLYLTHVNYDGPADTYFPRILGSWNIMHQESFKDGSQFKLMWRNG